MEIFYLYYIWTAQIIEVYITSIFRSSYETCEYVPVTILCVRYITIIVSTYEIFKFYKEFKWFCNENFRGGNNCGKYKITADVGD